MMSCTTLLFAQAARLRVGKFGCCQLLEATIANKLSVKYTDSEWCF
jgi:hypothetical protein